MAAAEEEIKTILCDAGLEVYASDFAGTYYYTSIIFILIYCLYTYYILEICFIKAFLKITLFYLKNPRPHTFKGNKNNIF